MNEAELREIMEELSKFHFCLEKCRQGWAVCPCDYAKLLRKLERMVNGKSKAQEVGK